MDILWLEHEHHGQISVKFRQSGPQIGHLDPLTVSQMQGDTDDEVRWVAIFKRPLRHPITRRVFAAEIVLVRLTLKPER